ncbi:MAG: DegT/DnrJ/EryC1/StrS family aminotransferase [Nanoarchaeota archaeon]|nr:DegT/DnrJ/EryC1/StrS family aminotransferase [Nanoarchaeota archaeon]MBU1135666.1 DegT/DnrJ/EryC1/StrS family aminotransferase [Nanoarchaeota archaeon]MBU2520540.1 DegT/DnrJ/EryC1/StrS family aminotransferase [Nanoarchaeota archaeon]
MDKPAIEGGEPIRNEFLPFGKPTIGEEEINEMVDTLKSGWLSMGPKTIKFEEAFKEYVGADYAISCNSCTMALFLSLYSLGIKPGDEVILPTTTFASAANVIVHLGAKPVFADVTRDTYNIDPDKIEEKITDKTKAIMPMHHSGHSADMDRILEIAQKHNLSVIEDAAHGVGSEYKGKKIGSISDATCFSFYATKTMTTGEGGMITTNNEELANKLRTLRLHGISSDAWKRYSDKGSWYYEVMDAGFKANMTDMQAALGLHQLKKLDGFIETRQKNAELYTKLLSDVPGIKTPTVKDDIKHSWYIYTILIDGLKINRDEVIKALRAENIGTSVHFIPLHLQPFFQKTYGYQKGDFPNAEYVYDRMISLPFFSHMTEKDIEDACSAIKRIVNYYKA